VTSPPPVSDPIPRPLRIQSAIDADEESSIDNMSVWKYLDFLAGIHVFQKIEFNCQFDSVGKEGRIIPLPNSQKYSNIKPAKKARKG